MDLGEGGSSSSDSTNLDEVAKETVEAEKGKESSTLVSQAPKNPFASPTVATTPAKRKMFSVESLGTASKVISIELWLEETLERKGKRK